MQANCVTNYEQQGQDQQNGQAKDKAVAQLQDCRQALHPNQVQLGLFHLRQLGQLLAQGVQPHLVDLFGRDHHNAGQWVLRQLAQGLAQPRLFLELIECLLAADIFGLGHARQSLDLITQGLALTAAGVQLQVQRNLRGALPGAAETLNIAQQQGQAHG
ncbi:hypothetical protein D3C80_874520 [compost metagenome]